MSGTPDRLEYIEIKPRSSNHLSSRYVFPDVEKADRHGFLAFGADLQPDTLLAAYNRGIFPWYMRAPVQWYSPPQRQVIFINEFHASRSLKKLIRQNRFRVTFNTAFHSVIKECAQQREGDTWITNAMIDGYTELHHLSYAVSGESWLGDRLVGGVYGVIVGKIFCAESMFFKEPSASKVALASMVHVLKENGFALVDCQVFTENTLRFGAKLIPRNEYMKLLEQYK